ncbi:MAG: hypothetical protein JKX70_01390 [Phycisphaerales bacterium]|nr:hypothetical protein [Phycisphaerales bacterium]
MTKDCVNLPTNEQWISHIGSLIKQPLIGVPFDGPDDQKRTYIDSFADEYGNRRSTDRPFLAYLLGITLENPTDMDALDQQLWWMIQANCFDSEKACELIEPTDALVHNSDSLAIEYRTMVELCALHALWIIAKRSGSQPLIDRCLNAAAWHTRELQPDNAINRPWATQVFIALSQTSDDVEQAHLAHLHAQTLIHNTSINLGVPDILSALILHDVITNLGAM